MVHIKKVEIFGFKSFGFKNTIVQFEPGLISISGPNGSGKSNILDAIIFAMGENRPKIMRVDKLRSLLHDIEGQRHGPKLTRVNLTFDNSDHKIPIDSDIVDITREMDEKGENVYSLNKKHVNRSRIIELLNLANAGLNQLNAIQQGTVTRISEFTSEEKRQTIEDLIGLSDFDQKKVESIKQLDEADRRLEIALAKMGETKKRIDELEEERNQKLRYDMLHQEIDKFSAIAAADKLKKIKASKSIAQKDFDAAVSGRTQLFKERTTMREQISKLDTEKSTVMEQADTYNQAKATIDSDLSNARQQYDQIQSTIQITQKRIMQINQRIPNTQNTIEQLNNDKNDIISKTSDLQNTISDIKKSREQINQDLDESNNLRNIVLTQQSEIAKKKSIIDEKIQSLTEKLNSSKLAYSKIESEKNDIAEKIKSTLPQQSEYKKNSMDFSQTVSAQKQRIQNHSSAITELKAQISSFESKRTRILKEIDDLALILEKSTKAAAQYETKIRVVKSIMHEDYTIAKLHDVGEQLGIDGLVYQKISWDKQYERAILAAGADWIKAFVVEDFATLLSLAEIARDKKLPKLKIIPMEAIPDFKMSLPDGGGIIGILSNFVKSTTKYAKLKTFLFGNVILVDSQDTAYRVSKAGYRAVTLNGELFEAHASAVVIDISSKISKLTKIITMSSSVDGLIQLISLLKKYVIKKKHELARIDDTIYATKERCNLSESELASTTQSYTDSKSRVLDISQRLSSYERRLGEYSQRKVILKANALKEESYIDSLNQRIMLVQENYADGEQTRVANDLERLNMKKSLLEQKRDTILAELNGHSTDLGIFSANQTKIQTQITNHTDEIVSMREEKMELETRMGENEVKKVQYDKNLIALRDKEQELIATSGTSVSELKSYDDRLRKLNDTDKTMTREINGFERQSDSLSRDLAEFTKNETQLLSVLESVGFDENIETFDVSHIKQGLQSELNSLTALNAKAPETFLIVSSGYRQMSGRKNSLEEERNSIVRFIEEIEKDKRQTFLNAFDVVDKEIQTIFTSMTGGRAWLELQNEDDIFNSGISYLIQFPNKQKRESTSISGGEKTLAAIVFVLALQKLKPSPFYLFDEVDAHLDAPNSKRLSDILAKRAKESQFIMVSLKDSVIQRAKLIYGVFPKNGVSHVVTYKDRRMPKVTT